MEKNFDVVAAGHICLDMLPRFNNDPDMKISDILRPGTLVKMGDMTFGTGGAVSNTGIAMKIFGLAVGYVAKVGDDAIGKTIIDLLNKQGNAEGISISRGEASSYTVVLSPQGIDRIFLHSPGTNDTFTAKDIDFEWVAKSRLFHLGYPTLMDSLYMDGGDELATIYRKAKEAGVATSMDISLPDPSSPAGKADWRAIYKKALPYVDLYVPSIEEAYFTLHPEEYPARKEKYEGEELIDHMNPDEFTGLAKEFLDMGCGMVALKAGHNGWYFAVGDKARLEKIPLTASSETLAGQQLWCPAFQVDTIASATGSGDTSIAAFLVALLKGYDLPKALRTANAAGYMCLKGMDALSGLCSWDELTATVPTLKPRDNGFLSEYGWQMNAETGVWTR